MDFTLPANTIYNQWRALTGSHIEPRASFKVNDEKRVIYFENMELGDPEDYRDEAPVKALHWDKSGKDKKMYIKCGDGKWVSFKSARIEGFGKLPAQRIIERVLEN